MGRKAARLYKGFLHIGYITLRGLSGVLGKSFNYAQTCEHLLVILQLSTVLVDTEILN